MTEASWRLVAMMPGAPEVGTFGNALECAEAAEYVGGILGIVVTCFKVVGI